MTSPSRHVLVGKTSLVREPREATSLWFLRLQPKAHSAAELGGVGQRVSLAGVAIGAGGSDGAGPAFVART